MEKKIFVIDCVEDVEQTLDYLNTCIDLMQSEYSKLRTWTDDHIDMSDPI